MAKNFLTIDNGGTNTKVIIVDDQGTQLAVSSFPTKDLQPHSDFHEVDLDQLWADLQDNIKKALQKANLEGADISAVSTVGHGKGLYVTDQNGHIYTHGILSADNRAESYAVKFEKQIDQIFPISHQHVMASQAPLILRWLKDHDADTYQQIGHVFSNKDFVGYLLTGEVKQEIGDASGNNFINLETQQYDQRLFDFFGISEMYSKMPPLIHATDQRGTIPELVAKLTGLRPGTPVFGGMFDIDACSVATGVLDDSKFSLIAGTWNMNIFPSDEMADQKSGLMNSIFPTGKYLLEASSPTSAGNLAQILQKLMSAEIAQAKAVGHSIYEQLENFLQETDAKCSKVWFFPFLYGSNVSPDAEGAFIGLRSNTEKMELIRAVYEGIAFAHRYHVDQLVNELGHLPAVIRMSGGATNSPAWVQMFADVLHTPIELVSATELGGLGGAINSAVGLGVYPSIEDAVDQMSTVVKRFDPDESQSRIYDQKYATYKSLLKALDPVWKDVKATQNNLE